MWSADSFPDLDIRWSDILSFHSSSPLPTLLPKLAVRISMLLNHISHERTIQRIYQFPNSTSLSIVHLLTASTAPRLNLCVSCRLRYFRANNLLRSGRQISPRWSYDPAGSITPHLSLVNRKYKICLRKYSKEESKAPAKRPKKSYMFEEPASGLKFTNETILN